MKLKLTTLAIPTLTSLLAFAGSPAPDKAVTTTANSEASSFEKLWGLATLYQDKDNPLIQEISLFGRAHANWAAVDTDHGDWSDWELRRLRAGLRVKFLRSLDFKAEARFLPLVDPSYAGLTEASLTWTLDPTLRITFGKQLPRYTQEGEISSNDLRTVERSLLSGTFWGGEDNASTGISFAGEISDWQYSAAVLSGETNKDFGNLDAGWYGFIGVGYDFGKMLGLETAVLRVDYVYNDGNPLNTTPKLFQNTAVFGWEVKQGRYYLVGNLITGSGIGTQPDVWGFVLIPTYDLTQKLQLVARYTFLDSAGPDGLSPQRRYENEVPGITYTRGDHYQAMYAGLNYYIYGHKLKLQSGIEYSHMRDSANNGGAFKAWAYSTGIRFSF